MHPDGEHDRDWISSLSTAHGWSMAGVVLLVVFLATVTASFWPVRLFEPAWQLQVGGSLIGTAPIALTGLVLLHLAAEQAPDEPLLAWRRRAAARLATLVPLGFLLLIPLLALAAVQQQQMMSTRRTGFEQAAQRLQALRRDVAAASSVPMLRQALEAQQGPRLTGEDLRQPLPLLKSRVNRVLDRFAAEIAQRRAAVPNPDPTALMVTLLRTTLTSAAMAVGFAGLARRRGSDLSLLLEWQWRKNHGRWFRAVGSPRRDSVQEMVALLSQEESQSEQPDQQG